MKKVIILGPCLDLGVINFFQAQRLSTKFFEFHSVTILTLQAIFVFISEDNAIFFW